jgi:hypothetical protein
MSQHEKSNENDNEFRLILGADVSICHGSVTDDHLLSEIILIEYLICMNNHNTEPFPRQYRLAIGYS